MAGKPFSARLKAAQGSQRQRRPMPVATNQPSAGAITTEDKAALPILGNEKKERELVKYVLDRVKLADDERKRRAERAHDVDVQLSGFIQLSADDKKRRANNKKGKTPKPTDHNLPLAEAQIDEAVTYLMSVYAPEMDLFEAVAPADKQHLARALSQETNKQGQKGQYYRHFAKAMLNALKYNFAGVTCYWESLKGLKLVAEAGGTVTKKTDTIWEGNVISSIDIYNFLYDTSVHPVDLPQLGEYFATVSRATPFRVRKMAQDKQLFGIERYVKEVFGDGMRSGGDGHVFYIQPPSVRDEDTGQQGGVTNWVNVLRADTQNMQESTPGIEFINYVGWVNPKKLGLGSENELQLWRITIANSKYLTFATRLEDTHGMLPIALACPAEDDLKNEQRSHAEKLIPLQHFASFLMNSHQAATRKAIYGITFYNQNLFPGLDKDRDELIGALIPFRSTSTDIDVDKAVRHYNNSPGTEQNLQQIGETIQLMQKILPTDLARQVADLERATKYQAAATVQAGNRRQLKIARIIHDQMLGILKFQMLYNIYANMQSLSYIGPDGARVNIPIAECVAAEVEYDISTGLKGLDRLMMLEIIKDVVNGILQSQQGIQEIDIVKLLDYYFSLAGDRTDLNQFRRQAPAAPVAGQPAQPGAQPAVNPPNGGQLPNP